MNAKIMPDSVLQESPLSEAMDQADDQNLDPAQQAARCGSIWAAALGLLVEDAIRHATGAKKPFNVPDYELEAAFDDICRLGPMLTHLCRHTGDNPEWIRDQTKRVILEIRDGERGLKVRAEPKKPPTGAKRGGRQRAVPD